MPMGGFGRVAGSVLALCVWSGNVAQNSGYRQMRSQPSCSFVHPCQKRTIKTKKTDTNIANPYAIEVSGL